MSHLMFVYILKVFDLPMLDSLCGTPPVLSSTLQGHQRPAITALTAQSRSAVVISPPQNQVLSPPISERSSAGRIKTSTRERALLEPADRSRPLLERLTVTGHWPRCRIVYCSQSTVYPVYVIVYDVYPIHQIVCLYSGGWSVRHFLGKGKDLFCTDQCFGYELSLGRCVSQALI